MRQNSSLRDRKILRRISSQIYRVLLILAVPPAVAWAILVYLVPSLKVYAAFWSLIVAILDALVLEPLQRSWKRQAATIQELFDCEVLHLAWHEFKVGSRPDAESIAEAAGKFQRKNPEYATLKDWYPVSVGRVPLPFARLICQRTNCWWDARLRCRYATAVVVGLAALTVLVFVIGLLGEMSLEKFTLAVLAPLTPALLWGMREYRGQREAAETVDRLKAYADRLWHKVMTSQLSSEQTDTASRELQNEIYDHRRQSPVIFDSLYRRFRRDDEAQMNVGADALVQEALRHLRPGTQEGHTSADTGTGRLGPCPG